MEDNKFEVLKKADSYLVERRQPTEAEKQLFLKEVDFACPLCGCDLRNTKQQKANQLYEIAHIYPNSPTKEQYTALEGVERLGENCEAFENKIALCMKCHSTQDYHTQKRDYEKLLNIKKDRIVRNRLLEATFETGLEQEIASVVEKITEIDEKIEADLNDFPVDIKNKFYPYESILKTKISINVTQYYPYIRDLFKSIDGKNDFSFSALCSRIKSCYEKMKPITNNKEYIFNTMTNWIMNKTGSTSRAACEIVISFFVQNCEVFDEIT